MRVMAKTTNAGRHLLSADSRLLFLLLSLTVMFAALAAACNKTDEGVVESDPIIANAVEVTSAAASTYSEVIQDCVFSPDRTSPCTLKTLPLIGQEVTDPAIDDVMGRVVVSDEWMGTRFRELLEILPEEILTLCKPLTGIVIAGNIRPSRYRLTTGAIYIDPKDLWFTTDEKATVEQGADYRAGYGLDLQFSAPWRYVLGSSYAFTGVDWSVESRTMDDIKYRMAQLLFHELAHANDFIPYDRIDGLSDTKTVIEEIAAAIDDTVSTRMDSVYPLGSEMLKSLAQVRFGGETSTEEQNNILPEEAADEFKPDSATDTYSYYTRFEDLAMIFEEAMMDYHFGIKRDIAFTTLPSGDNPPANDYIVAWGVRNRIADPVMRDKAIFVISNILPDLDMATHLDTLPAPVELEQGAGWIDAITLGAAVKPEEAERYKSMPAKLLLFTGPDMR
jgi:hypothetical protein